MPVKIEADSGLCVVIEDEAVVKLEQEIYDSDFEQEDESFTEPRHKAKRNLAIESTEEDFEADNLTKNETLKEPEISLVKTKPKRKKNRIPTYKRVFFPCDQCEKKPQTARNLAKHKYKCHEGPKPQAMFICEICSKQINSTQGLRRHNNMHNQNKKFFCGKIFFFSNKN